MRIIFAGTPYFSVQALARLLTTKHDVVLVLTQPDRSAGRGLNVALSSVKQFCLERGVEIYQPLTLHDPTAIERLRVANPQVLVVAAYGLILPQGVLDLVQFGALNIHASLLPRWRGAAPIQRAILAGDRQTGISIMQMDAGLDTGAVLTQREIPISDRDSAQTLHDTLAALGAEMIIDALNLIERGDFGGTPQPIAGITYASKIDKAEAALDWRKSSTELDRAVRAFNPFPGAHARFGDTMVKIWRARRIEIEKPGSPGCVLTSGEDGIVVACGEGALALIELQRAGARRLCAREFLHGRPLANGTLLAPPN